MQSRTLISTIFLFLTLLANASFANSSFTAKELAVQAVSENPKAADLAVKELRELGETGLQALFETFAVEIEHFKSTGTGSGRWQKIALAIDTVAMQKDAYASKLFWHRDLGEAQIESKRTNKPILSLRLLGNLNEEFSCDQLYWFGWRKMRGKT